MSDLLDVNVWLALIDEKHFHHKAALNYWNETPLTQKAFCRITQLAFLRISTREGILSGSLSYEESWQVYQQYLSLPFVHFVSDPPDLDNHFQALTMKTFPHRLWTDAYLASLAKSRKMRLISFDSDFNQFQGLTFFQLTD